jgi:hypothetical protein
LYEFEVWKELREKQVALKISDDLIMLPREDYGPGMG